MTADWSLYNKAKVFHLHSNNIYNIDKQLLDADVDHVIALHVDNPKVAWDTDKLWIILRQSISQHQSFSVSTIK